MEYTFTDSAPTLILEQPTEAKRDDYRCLPKKQPAKIARVAQSRFNQTTPSWKPYKRGMTISSTEDIYEGELQNGVPHGTGKMHHSQGASYEGEFQNGLPHGKGKRIGRDGSLYTGDFFNGKPHGQGKLVCSDGLSIFEGEFKEGEWQLDLTVLLPSIDTNPPEKTTEQTVGCCQIL